MDNFDHDGPSAAQTLDNIRLGGQQLIMLANRRVADAQQALREGDFPKAVQHLEGARAAVSPLANAQAFVGIASDGHVVKAKHLEVGMELVRIGIITAVEIAECQTVDCAGHVTVTVGDHGPLELTGDVELWVSRGAG